MIIQSTEPLTDIAEAYTLRQLLDILGILHSVHVVHRDTGLQLGTIETNYELQSYGDLCPVETIVLEYITTPEYENRTKEMVDRMRDILREKHARI